MKKVLIIAVALLMALPAVSFAGSATSRWDLTIGGFVKIDAGYTNQNAGLGGLEEYFAGRNNLGPNQSIQNTGGGQFAMAMGQTTLNFLVKGPDAWGAKTSAFVQGNFVGQTTNNGQSGTRYGTFTMSHAYMDFTWANSKLTVGQTWQPWGFLPSYNFLGLYDILMAARGTTVPQITWNQNFTKNFYGTFAISDPYKPMDQIGMSGSTGQAQPTTTGVGPVTTTATGTALTNPRASTKIPDLNAEIGWKSDACGKIGPWNLQFGFGGLYGQDTISFLDPSVATSNRYDTSKLNRWAGAFKFFIPIIPEKNLNKAGALSISGVVWTGQNLSNFYMGARQTGAMIPYDQNLGLGVSYATPVQTGGWGQISYYFTDKVYFNGLYAQMNSNVSNIYEKKYANQFRGWKQYIANVLYDVNPAVRVGIEGEYGQTQYNFYGGSAGELAGYNAGALLDTKGSYWTGRVAFWYFF